MKVFVDGEILTIFSFKKRPDGRFSFGTPSKAPQTNPARGYAATGECKWGKILLVLEFIVSRIAPGWFFAEGLPNSSESFIYKNKKGPEC